ncbi:MAG: hypothetical protein ACOCZS_05085, partial [Verrucomicrobiota bacterium]
MKLLKFAIIVFWLVSFSWLLRQHAAPGLFSDHIQGYEGLVGSDTLVKDDWLTLHYHGDPFGYLHYKLETEDGSPDKYYRLTNTVRLKLRSTARPRPIQGTISSTVELDLARRLQSFNISFSTMRDGTLLQLTGERKGKEEYNVNLTLNDDSRNFPVNIPEDTVFSFPLGGYTFSRLKPGDSIAVEMIEPLTWESRRLLFNVDRRDTAILAGESIPVTIVESEYRGIGIEFQFADDGRLIRQQTTTGLVAERSSPETATETLRQAEGLDIGFLDPAQIPRLLQ